MKTALFLVLLAFVVCSPVYSQKYHTPAELFKIMEESKIAYGIQVTSASSMAIEADNYHNNLAHPGLYEEEGSDGRIAIRSYMDIVPKDTVVFPIFHKAEKYFASGKMEEARELYNEMLEYYPDNSQIMTYIGQTYQKERDRENARKWLEKAVKTNRLDYMAHWFLADLSMDEGNMDKAVRHIVIAHVLNRNNPRLQFSLERILKANGTPYDNWEFIPIYRLDTTERGTPLITIADEHPEWMIYAMCKALWAFEPGYAQLMLGKHNDPPALIEEKEALIALAVKEIRQTDNRSTNNIRQLAQIIKDGQLDAFALYEVVFRKFPNMAAQLPTKMFDIFQQYILTYHTKKE